jgi:hypothetical protein
MNQYQENMRAYVLDVYIRTGKHLFVTDVAKAFKTNALGVRNTLGYDDFVFDADDRWTGDNMTGRYIQSPCVEPTKSHLVNIIRALRAA